MLEYLKEEAEKTLTENGAATYSTTGSDCLDLFSSIGALRSASKEEIADRFFRAFAENRELAMKTLFFARDVRGGLGERRVFRVILSCLAECESESLRKNIALIPEYGRFDDLLTLLGTACETDAVKLISAQLEKDIYSKKDISLLAKWLPSVNASNADTVKNGKRLARLLGMSEAQYRKTLSALRKKTGIIENNLREKDYTFDYSKQPSRAMFKYRKAFMKNDMERYSAFFENVRRGEATLRTGTLMPYDIVTQCIGAYWPGRQEMTLWERRSLDTAWNALENFGTDENALVVVDGSLSMYGGIKPWPISVALSLGIYFAERNRGKFKNHFLTFSEKPCLVKIKGSDIYKKVRYCSSFCDAANTNLQAVFELILKTAVKHTVPQSDMPKRLYIVSDMEFDSCICGADITNFEYAKSLFESHGYELPQVVFWNAQSRMRQQPVRMNEAGVALVSGCTPRLFSMVAGETVSPYQTMLEILGSERYAAVTA